MIRPVFEGEKCSYQCPFYMDGAALSICRKYGNNALKYRDATPPPLRRDECISEFGTGDLIEGNEFAPGVISPEKWHDET